MNEHITFDVDGVYDLLRILSEKNIANYIHDALMDKFGTSPTVEELRQYYSSDCKMELPQFTAEQKLYATEAMLNHMLEDLHSVSKKKIEQFLTECNTDLDDEGYPYGDE